MQIRGQNSISGSYRSIYYYNRTGNQFVLQFDSIRRQPFDSSCSKKSRSFGHTTVKRTPDLLIKTAIGRSIS